MYFRCQLAVKPDGWAYINGGLPSPRCMVKPMAVREGDVQVRRHTRCSSVMQPHRTGRSHTSDRVSQTFCISCAGDGPRAPTRMLSLNCAKDTVFPRGVVHSGCPLGEKESWPIRLIKSVRCLAAQMDLRSALWALNGPPMGMAPVRDHTLPEACVYVSVNSEPTQPPPVRISTPERVQELLGGGSRGGCPGEDGGGGRLGRKKMYPSKHTSK